jgi:enamine deaminase RidA (YjgF/YER057c/UK114 family)
METTTGFGKYDAYTLGAIKANAFEVSGQWNGDESGVLEDRATIADDITQAVRNLEELLDELGENELPDADFYKDLALNR